MTYDPKNLRRMHRELGYCNLHTLHGLEMYGRLGVYALFRRSSGYDRHCVSEGRGATFATALADALPRIKSSVHDGQITLGVRLALLTLLMEDRCAETV